MKRQTASAATVGTLKRRVPVGGGPGTVTPLDRVAHRDPATGRPRRALASVSTRAHTLILTGVLNTRSALTLEAEIERLYEDGVTDITLDLRELTYVDSIGVAVIAFRCGLSARRGYGFALIAGAPAIHDVFVQAGVAESLPFREDESS